MNFSLNFMHVKCFCKLL
uniref:Uncharacterized protein n=1 Tax=Arundo donax TaxID=35708 RepID=A0A0A9AC76_ARUDO